RSRSASPRRPPPRSAPGSPGPSCGCATDRCADPRSRDDGLSPASPSPPASELTDRGASCRASIADMEIIAPPCPLANNKINESAMPTARLLTPRPTVTIRGDGLRVLERECAVDLGVRCPALHAWGGPEGAVRESWRGDTVLTVPAGF